MHKWSSCSEYTPTGTLPFLPRTEGRQPDGVNGCFVPECRNQSERVMIGRAEPLRRPLALVVSYSFLDFCGPLSDMDLAILPEVGPLRDCDQWDAGRKRPRSRDYEGLRVPYFPVFGFLPESEHLSNGEELRLRSIFTQIMSPYLDEYQPGQARTIALTSRLPAFADEPTSREVLRSAIYENEERNREVAKISAGESTDWVRVLLLVESPLHASRLAELLPEWTVHDHGAQVVGERNLIITDACLTKQKARSSSSAR